MSFRRFGIGSTLMRAFMRPALTGSLRPGTIETFNQDVEKGLRHCSRVAQSLNVRQRVRLGFSLAAAALGGLFDHPAGMLFRCPHRDGRDIRLCPKRFFNNLLEDEDYDGS